MAKNNFFHNQNVHLIGGVLIILVAIIIGLTQKKIPARTTDLNNQSMNANTTSTQAPARLPDGQLQVNVRLETTKGPIVIALDSEQGPIAASNFVTLVRAGFYDGIIWHRVEDWVAQVGDPQTKDASVSPELWGTGGPGYTIPDEPVSGEYLPGVVAMARTLAPNSAGSQIFIMKKPVALDKVYAIFGRVTTGLDIVQTLARGDKIIRATVEARTE